ncbi:MAG: indole-3-glycerol phosphate synthase TrpC [Ilumatobacteraceae bacterium]
MYLDDILKHHRALAKEDHRDVNVLAAEARLLPHTKSFHDAIADASRRHLAVIAEIKRRSPSKGTLNPTLDPVQIAKTYADGGASCLSVLTDEKYFGGSKSDLVAARGASVLPVLRKDFTISLSDVCDTRLMGADCVLLIVAALSRSELSEFHQMSHDIGLEVLVEVHDEDELEWALDIGANLIGVNQRDLTTFEVDHTRAQRLATLIPSGVVKVAESGVRNRDDARALRDSGYDAVLVGESLITSDDIAVTLQALLVP